MKKISLLFLILTIFVGACKNRKLAIEKGKTETRTETKEKTTARSEKTEVKETTAKQTEKVSDQSGTWIWEEWYQKDLAADTVPHTVGLVYKRTTYVKNDVQSTKDRDISTKVNTSEIKDTSAIKEAVTNTKTETRIKNLEAEQSGIGWVWTLSAIIVLMIILVFVIKSKPN